MTDRAPLVISSGQMGQLQAGDSLACSITGNAANGVLHLTTPFTNQTSVTVTHNFGNYPIVQVIDGSGIYMEPASLTHASVNAFTVTFSDSQSGNIICVY